MAKERNPARRQTITESVHALGVRGRKTGIELPDTGIRDEHGMEPLENLFSSPERENVSRPELGNETIDEEVDMELDSPGGGPAPADFLHQNNPRTRLLPPGIRPLPRTSLNSPPIRHPGLLSVSPSRASAKNPPSSSPPMQPVKRKLTFSSRTNFAPPQINGSRGAVYEEEEEDKEEEIEEQGGGLVDEQAGEQEDDQEDDQYDQEDDQEDNQEDDQENNQEDDQEYNQVDDQEDEPIQEEDMADKYTATRNGYYSMSMADDGMSNEEVYEAEEPIESVPVSKPKRHDGAIRVSGSQAIEVSDKPKPRGRPKGKRFSHDSLDNPPKKRRTLHSLEEEEDESHSPELEPELEPRNNSASMPLEKRTTKSREQLKLGNPSNKGTKTLKAKHFKAPPQPADTGDESVLIQQAPPLPRKPGLSIVRHIDERSLTTTRSGRHSFKPLAYWRGEKVVTEQERVQDPQSHRPFIVEAVSEVVRVDQTPPRPRKSKAGKKRQNTTRRQMREYSLEDEEVPREPWEKKPGIIMADVYEWTPELEDRVPDSDDEMHEMQIAVSDKGLKTDKIRDASFRFHKTLGLPWFGTGVVDMPPGSHKRPKNTKANYMGFFVHTGSLEVTVNEVVFNIGAGGHWLVPRGNEYGMRNTTDKPARVFYCQGREMMADQEQY